MFFSKNDISAELLGVFKIKRENFNHHSFGGRAYDSLSIRLAGSAKFKTEKEAFNIKKGDILYIPKGADYKQTAEEETVIAIHFINYSHEKDNKIERLTIEDNAHALELFSLMYDVWKEKKQGHGYLCTSLFYELLHFLYCQQAVQFYESITHENEMNIAMDYIHTNYRKGPIEISHLAQMCAVSETYFRKLFKKLNGVSPQQYIINLKLEFAFHLLGSNLYSVNEVSQKSGFQDTKYFSRAFKQHYGYSPREVQTKSELFNLKQK